MYSIGSPFGQPLYQRPLEGRNSFPRQGPIELHVKIDPLHPQGMGEELFSHAARAVHFLILRNVVESLRFRRLISRLDQFLLIEIIDEGDR